MAGATESSNDEDRCFLGSSGSPGTSSMGGSGYEDAVEQQDGGSKADDEPEVSTKPQVSKSMELPRYGEHDARHNQGQGEDQT